MRNISPEDLTKERNLYDIYRQARKLRGSRYNQIFTLVIFLLLSLYAFFSSKSTSDLAQEVRTWSDLGFSFSTTILGFLIAGFTIFATVSDPSLFTAMARIMHKSGLSYLKYNFFTLMNVFILYIFFSIFCLLIKLFAGTSGIISILLSFMFDNPSLLGLSKRILVSIGLIGVGTWFAYLLLLLQSFIFNTYYIVMTSIRWELEKEDRNTKEQNNVSNTNN